MKNIIAVSLLSCAISATATAESFYAGGGLGMNSLSGFDDATGFQIFGGYDFDYKILDDVSTAVEVGYMDSGDFKFTAFGFSSSASASGLWATGVASYPLNDKVSLIGRAGLDFGDDDGLMFGFGAGYSLNEQLSLRAEYVIRSDINSLQFNAAYHF